MPEKQGRGAEIDYRGVAVGAGVIAAMTLFAMVAMVWVFDLFAKKESRNQPPPATWAQRASGQLPPEPRLQADPTKDLAAFVAAEEARLSAYAWADESAGIARIPIGRAMEILVQRGLPARAASQAQAATANREGL